MGLPVAPLTPGSTTVCADNRTAPIPILPPHPHPQDPLRGQAGAPLCSRGHSPSAQVGPFQPDGQWHSNPEGTSWHEPPLAHGLEAQACSAALGTRGRGGGHGGPGPLPFSECFSPGPQSPKAGGTHCTRRLERWGPARVPRKQPGASSWPPHTLLTVLARVAVRAGAVVLVGLGVDACAPIGARVVAATVIQVWGQGRVLMGQARPCPSPRTPSSQRRQPSAEPPAHAATTFVAEQAAPIGLTVALPGLHAAAVHTARVWDTLITEPPLPAVAAPGEGRGAGGPVVRETPELWLLPG